MFKKLIILIGMIASQNLFSHQPSPKVAVIGAGLSGLTAAYRLHEKGWDVDVYEARSRVGGRVLTVDVQGHLAELGGRNIIDGGAAEQMRGLIEEMGLQTEETKSLLQIYYCVGGEMFEFEEILKSRNLVPETLRVQLDALKQSARNMQEVLQALFDEDDILYKVCMTHLCGYEGATADKLSTNYIETLYNYLIGGISAAHQTSQENETSYIDFLVVKGGNYLLPKRLAAKLSNRLFLDHQLIEIAKNTQGSYLLTFQNGDQVTADVVILTIPCSLYKEISIPDDVIPSKRRADIESIEYGKLIKVAIPLSPLLANDSIYTNGEFVSFMNRSHSVLDLYYIAPLMDASFEERFARDFPFLQKIYKIPSAPTIALSRDELLGSYSTAVAHSWGEDRFAKGSYSYCGAGHEELFTSTIDIGEKKFKALFAPIDNSLFFAGEHTSTLFHVGGTMEAAVQSGNDAAWLVEKCCLKSEFPNSSKEGR